MCVIILLFNKVEDTIAGLRHTHVWVLLVKTLLLILKVSCVVRMTRLPHTLPIIQHTSRLLVNNLWRRLPVIENFWFLLFPRLKRCLQIHLDPLARYLILVELGPLLLANHVALQIGRKKFTEEVILVLTLRNLGMIICLHRRLAHWLLSLSKRLLLGRLTILLLISLRRCWSNLWFIHLVELLLLKLLLVIQIELV